MTTPACEATEPHSSTLFNLKNVLVGSLLFVLACCMARPLRDPDLWFHIVSGRWILAHHEVPTQDYWNMFGVGRPWRAYSWLSEILFALIEGRFGLRGLISAEVCVTFLVVASLARCYISVSRSYVVGVLLTVLTAVGSYWHITLRPQTLTWILYPMVILLSEKIRTRGLSVGYGVRLVAILWLWANIHVSTIIPLATIALLVEGHRLLSVGAVLGATFLATLLTPNLGAEWLSAINYAGHPFTYTIISELRPATIVEPWTIPLLLSAALLLALYHLIPRALSWRALAGQLVLLSLSLAIMRFIPFALMLTCALIARIVGENGGHHLALLKILDKPRVRFVLFVGLVALLIPSVNLARSQLERAWGKVTDSNTVPRAAVDFMESRSLPQPVLNAFEDGHYLIYRYSNERGEPRYLVPIDGRTEVNTKEAWDEFRAAYSGAEQWQDFVDLVKPQTILWPTGSPFVRILTATGEWCLVYQEAPITGTAVLVRRNVWKERRSHLDAVNCFE